MAKLTFPAKKKSDCQMVTVPVDIEHPLLKLKAALPWQELHDIAVSAWRKAGKNVDGGRGRIWDSWLCLRIVILTIVMGLQSRQMEQQMAENAVMRVFVECQDHQWPQVRDHSTIARIVESLDQEAYEMINDCVLRTATELGLADIKELSADTTVQEVPIGYPNEPGILKGLAERSQRALLQLKNKGVESAKQVVSTTKEIINSAKHSHLFAKTQEEKEQTLCYMMEQTRLLQDQTYELINLVQESKDRTVASARDKLAAMNEVADTLIPQILHWLCTGKVAKDKILHAGIPQARAIVKNKAGKQTEFGFKYLIGRIGGGYLFGKLFIGNVNEQAMPRYALQEYQRIFGSHTVPELVAYDRGGYSDGNISWLQKQGVSKVGIQPKGQKPWSVSDQDQEQVKKARARTEGDIGSLKSSKYGFNFPKQRKLPNLRASGVKCILSQNLNRFMRDLTRKNTRPAAIVS